MLQSGCSRYLHQSAQQSKHAAQASRADDASGDVEVEVLQGIPQLQPDLLVGEGRSGARQIQWQPTNTCAICRFVTQNNRRSVFFLVGVTVGFVGWRGC